MSYYRIWDDKETKWIDPPVIPGDMFDQEKALIDELSAATDRGDALEVRQIMCAMRRLVF